MAVKDLVSGVLAESITTSTTNVLVTIAENIGASGIQAFFPTPPFYITIMPKSPAVGVANRLNSEILQVTAVGNDQVGNAALTCVRAQRDTTAKAFEAGSIVTVGVYTDDAVLLGEATGGRRMFKDKNGNNILPFIGSYTLFEKVAKYSEYISTTSESTLGSFTADKDYYYIFLCRAGGWANARATFKIKNGSTVLDSITWIMYSSWTNNYGVGNQSIMIYAPTSNITISVTSKITDGLNDNTAVVDVFRIRKSL